MEEIAEIELTERQVVADKLAVTVLGGLAGLAASMLVEKGYKAVMTAYRLKKAAAGQ